MDNNIESELFLYLIKNHNWTPLNNIHNTNQLWNNLRTIINKTNKDKLKRPLSDSEFNRVKVELCKKTRTPYDTGKFLYGNGESTTLKLHLDNNELVSLMVFNHKIESTYQIAHLVHFKNYPLVFNTILLIDGLPIIFINESDSGYDAKEILNQMNKMKGKIQYPDILSTIQICIAITPHDVRYMANTIKSKFNLAFAFHWKLDNGSKKPIRNWQIFAKYFLSTYQTKELVTNYIILDNTPNNESIKVMRPYQVYSTQRIIKKLRNYNFATGNHKIGYVWHTTGSGKTISSFKTAWLATKIPTVNKVIYLVDRIALSNQAANKYKAYDPDTNDYNKNGIVLGTSGTKDLGRKLKRNSTQIIVTSTQKLRALMIKLNFKLPNQNVVFIVDEAHQGIGKTFDAIKQAFPKSAWIGYTGTPRFKSKNNELTTEQVFGKPIHVYTISEAIDDQNVLGFNVHFKDTFKNDNEKKQYMISVIRKSHPNWDINEAYSKAEKLNPHEYDPYIYDMKKSHVKLVVKDIINNWKKRSNNYKYNAILTTKVSERKPSFPMVMMYYEEFQHQNKHLQQAGKRPLRIAVTFSPQQVSNRAEQIKKDKYLSDVIKGYNDEFNTHFKSTSINQIDKYMNDVISRLKKTNNDGHYLDLVIVVDQLLTGFDAPQLNTLYVDRVLKGAKLIQAYSRTNRIYNMQEKPFGNIINYRWPKISKQAMNKAIHIYANPQSAGIHQKGSMSAVTADTYSQLIDKISHTVTELSNLTDKFTKIPSDNYSQEKTYSILNRYSRQIAKIKQYDEYDPYNVELLLIKIGLGIKQDKWVRYVLSNKLKKQIAYNHDIDINDLTLKMEDFGNINIGHNYLYNMIAKYLDDTNTNKHDLEQKINKKLSNWNDQNYANQVKQIINSLKRKNDKTIKAQDIDNLVRKKIKKQINIKIDSFKSYWGLSHIPLKEYIYNDKLHDPKVISKIIMQGEMKYRFSANANIMTDNNIIYKIKLIRALNQLNDRIKE